MSPETPDTRINRLEQKMAALEQEVRNVVHDVDTLAPVQMAVVRIEEQARQIRDELSELRKAVAQDRQAAKDANDKLTSQIADDAKDARRTLRNGMWGIASALILAAGGIVAAGGHP